MLREGPDTEKFDLWYIDSFAGTGDRVETRKVGGLLEGVPESTVTETHGIGGEAFAKVTETFLEGRRRCQLAAKGDGGSTLSRQPRSVDLPRQKWVSCGHLARHPPLPCQLQLKKALARREPDALGVEPQEVVLG